VRTVAEWERPGPGAREDVKDRVVYEW
jgi:hypothetical protein